MPDMARAEKYKLYRDNIPLGVFLIGALTLGFVPGAIAGLISIPLCNMLNKTHNIQRTKSVIVGHDLGVAGGFLVALGAMALFPPVALGGLATILTGTFLGGITGSIIGAARDGQFGGPGRLSPRKPARRKPGSILLDS